MGLCLEASNSLLLVVDIQQRLAPAMDTGAEIIEVNSNLLRASQLLDVPVLVSEQYPEGIGRTVDELQSHLAKAVIVEKMTFSCMKDDGFVDALEKMKRKQVVVTGMETHVCVLQTVLELCEQGYQVFVVADGVASRQKENKKLGLDRMYQAGAQIVSSEMVMFEWLERAGTQEFKSILPLIK